MASLLPLCVASLLFPCFMKGQSVVPKLAPATPVDLQRLQGKWVGSAMVQDGSTGGSSKAPEKITITIQGDVFLFHRDTNFWFSTTIELPKGKSPQQLHATIRTNSPSQGTDAIGKKVVALVKLEGQTLTLAAKGDGDDAIPAGFGGENVSLYELQKQALDSR